MALGRGSWCFVERERRRRSAAEGGRNFSKLASGHTEEAKRWIVQSLGEVNYQLSKMKVNSYVTEFTFIFH